MFGQKEPPFNPNVKITDDDQHILYELTNGYELTDFNLSKKLRSTAARYHSDKYNPSDHSPKIIIDAERKFKILYELNKEFNTLDKTNLGKLVEQYRSVYTNSSIPNGFGKEKGPAPKQTEDKPIDPIKPEDKKFFDSFKRNYFEKSTAIDYTVKFDEKGLEKCFISFRDREYKKFVKSTNNSSGVTEFRHTSTFDKTNYENYIFFPDQPNPETPSHDQIILESYKQAVTKCKIAKPDDLSHPEKPSQDKAGDEYNFLNFKDDFIRSYKASNQTRGINTNPAYLTDRLRDRIEIFTGKKTKDDIEPKSLSIKEGMSRPEYNKLKEEFDITYAEYKALNSIFDKLCMNDNVKKFLDKEKTKYEDEKILQNEKAAKEKEAEDRKLKERENSIEERWSRFSKSLLELQEDASSRLAGVSSKIGSSLGSASSAVRGFNSNFLESAKKEVDSLAVTISTSVTTTFTEFSSTAMGLLTSMKLPEINLPSDKTDAQKNTETSHEPPKKEPAPHNEKKRRREDPRPEPEASKRAKTKTEGGAEKAKEAAEKAREAAEKARQEIERAKREKERAAKKDITPPTFQPPRPDVAFFGPRAQQHAANRRDKREIRNLEPAPNGPRKSTASSLDPRPSKKPRTQ